MRSVALTACVVLGVASAYGQGTGQFQVVGSQILDPAGNPFLIKGINALGPSSWWQNVRYLANDAGLIGDTWNFNAVRLNSVILQESQDWTDKENNDLETLVNAFTSKHVVVMFEAHDRTGGYFQNYTDTNGVVHHDLDELNAWYKSLATEFKNNPYVWFNIQNEPGNSTMEPAKWKGEYQSVIHTVRDVVGAHNVIVADGSNYAQDTGGNWTSTFLTDDQSAILSWGKDLLNFDGKNYDNIAFSFHPYSEWVAGGVPKMEDYVKRVEAKGLALIAGEYGGSDYLQVAQNMMSLEAQYHLGHLGWHWQDDGTYALVPSNGGWAINDPVNPTNLTPYGQLVWNDAHTPTVLPPMGVVMPANSTFDLANGSYTIASLADAAGGASGQKVLLGSGTLTTGADNSDTSFSGSISGTGNLVKIGTGAQTLTGRSTYTGTTDVSGGTLVLAATQTIGDVNVHAGANLDIRASQRFGKLSVDAGKALVAPGHDKVIVTNGLEIANNGMMDLTDNDMVVFYAVNSPEQVIQQYVLDALHSNNAHGLISSVAFDTGLSKSARALAVFDNHDAHYTSFDGVALSTDWNQVLVKYTYLGDANADGKVDPTDYAIVDGNQGKGHSWVTGDLNFDGKVDPTDYAQIDGNQGAGYGLEGGPPLGQIAGQPQFATSAAVPEPAEGLLMLVAGAWGLGRRGQKAKRAARQQSR
jgi:autotransporter-associated beta strand protein